MLFDQGFRPHSVENSSCHHFFLMRNFITNSEKNPGVIGWPGLQPFGICRCDFRCHLPTNQLTYLLTSVGFSMGNPISPYKKYGSVSSSQGESAPKRSKFQAETSEMHQMSRMPSDYVPGMLLDTQNRLQDWNLEDQVCNAVFSRSVQKLKRYLLNKIFECSENQPEPWNSTLSRSLWFETLPKTLFYCSPQRSESFWSST